MFWCKIEPSYTTIINEI